MKAASTKQLAGNACPVWDVTVEEYQNPLAFCHTDRGRSPKAAFSRRRTGRLSVRYQKPRRRILRDSYILEPEHPKQGRHLPQAVLRSAFDEVSFGNAAREKHAAASVCVIFVLNYF